MFTNVYASSQSDRWEFRDIGEILIWPCPRLTCLNWDSRRRRTIVVFSYFCFFSPAAPVSIQRRNNNKLLLHSGAVNSTRNWYFTHNHNNHRGSAQPNENRTEKKWNNPKTNKYTNAMNASTHRHQPIINNVRWQRNWLYTHMSTKACRMCFTHISRIAIRNLKKKKMEWKKTFSSQWSCNCLFSVEKKNKTNTCSAVSSLRFSIGFQLIYFLETNEDEYDVHNHFDNNSYHFLSSFCEMRISMERHCGSEPYW